MHAFSSLVFLGPYLNVPLACTVIGSNGKAMIVTFSDRHPPIKEVHHVFRNKIDTAASCCVHNVAVPIVPIRIFGFPYDLRSVWDAGDETINWRHWRHPTATESKQS